MSKQILTAMEFEEFQSLSDAFVERSSQGYGGIPASVFFELLFECIAEEMAVSSDQQNPNLPKSPTSR